VFSANYLAISESANAKVIPFNKMPTGDLVIVDLVVCNYNYGDPTSRNCTEDITYDLKVWLINPDGETADLNQFSIMKLTSLSAESGSDEKQLSGYTSENNCQKYVGETLSKSGHSDNFYRLTFPKSQLTKSNVHIGVKAEVNSNDYTSNDVKTLCSAIAVQYLDITTDRSWYGTISEYQAYSSTEYTPSDFSGFNYVAEGTAAGTVRISWNPEVFALSSYYNENAGFVSAITDYTYAGNYEDESLRGWKYIDIIVDPADETKNHKTRYSFEFYKGTDGWENLNWSQLGNDNCIKLNFSASE
jgi:hypothetical protein